MPILQGLQSSASCDQAFPVGDRGDIQMNSRKVALLAFGFYQVFVRAVCNLSQIHRKVTMRKTIRILGASLALAALVVFATGIVSDWNHNVFSNDVHCPYCHLGHQTPAQIDVVPAVSLLKPVASLPLPEDIVPATGPVFSQTLPRAPPTA
jgi:hypothetical protein